MRSFPTVFRLKTIYFQGASFFASRFEYNVCRIHAKLCTYMDNKRKINDGIVVNKKEDESDVSQAKRPHLPSSTFAVLLMYTGKGFYGMQRNVGFRTIEEEILSAMKKTDLITEDHFVCPGKIHFNRASKTDKNVSAAGQVISVKLPREMDTTALLNSTLPPEIRVLDAIKVTKSFNSKNAVDNRTYMYVCPTLAFAPKMHTLEELRKFRFSNEELERLRRLLLKYQGTKNYYNFTSGRKANDKSCVRYMIDLTCSEPYIRDDLEFVQITIIGQSFMLHQIRKMVALVMAVMGDFVDESIFSRVFKTNPQDIPKAPGLGLLLSSVNYWNYNKRYGSDGIHRPIDWNEYKHTIEDFRENRILSHIYKEEKQEESMLNWRETLGLHTFDDREPVRSDVVNKTVDSLDSDIHSEKSNDHSSAELSTCESLKQTDSSDTFIASKKSGTNESTISNGVQSSE